MRNPNLVTTWRNHPHWFMAKKQARGKPYSFLPVECVRRLRPSVFVLIALRMLGPLQARIPLAASIASFPVLLPTLVTVSSVSSQREVAKPTCSAGISTWLSPPHIFRDTQPGTRPRLSHCLHSQAPVLGSHRLLCLVLRGFPGPVQVLPLLETPSVLDKNLLSGLMKYLSTLASLANASQPRLSGVSSKCFGEHIV